MRAASVNLWGKDWKNKNYTYPFVVLAFLDIIKKEEGKKEETLKEVTSSWYYYLSKE